MVVVIIRLPDILVGGLRFYRGFFLLFFRQPLFALAQRNSTKTGHMHGSG